MRQVLFAAALSVTAMCSPTLQAQQGSTTADAVELQSQVDALQEQLQSQRASLLKPIVVNGVTVPVDRLRRELIYLVGSAQVNAKIAEFLTLEMMEQAIEEGRDPKEFIIEESELLADIQGLIDQLKNDPQTKDVDLWDAVRAQYGLDRDQFLEQRRQAMLFDRVFFPGTCDNWPAVTVEAIKTSSYDGQGEVFWENMLRDSAKLPGGKPPAMWLNLCRNWVQAALKKWSDIRYPADGLPAEVCLQVNDYQWRTDEAFETIQSGIFLQELERAVAEVALREVVRQELEAEDALIDDEAFKAAYDEYAAQFDGTIFSVDVVVTNFQRYPSLEAFRARWRLQEGFRRMIADEVTPENLKAHAEEFRGFFTNGKVNVQVIPFLARDKVTAGWVPDGMRAAKQRAEAAMVELENGATFESLMESTGEYFARDDKRGRLGSMALNQLRQAFREGEFTDLLTGFSAAKTVFYDAPVGKVTGPIRSSDAYYLVQVLNRSFSNAPIDIDDERTGPLVREDYVSHRFQLFVEAALAKAEIG